MAYNNARRVDMGAVFRALFTAIQWRLLLVWLLLLLIPTLVVALPVWGTLSELLDHSVHADAWAKQFDAMMAGDVVRIVSDQTGGLKAAAIAGTLVTLLLSPWLNGMIVGAGRSGRTPSMGEHLHNGLSMYGKMFRLLLWSVLLYAGAAWLVSHGADFADKHDEKAVLKSQGDQWEHSVYWLIGVLFVLVHAIVDSARSAYIADPSLRSATIALVRGVMQLLRRPLTTLFTYVLISAIGYGLILLLGMLRIQWSAASWIGLIGGVLLVQLLSAVTGWTQAARVFALAEVARSLGRRSF
jgi:hypothetical protein